MTGGDIATIVAFVILSQVFYWWYRLWCRIVDRAFAIVWPEKPRPRCP